MYYDDPTQVVFKIEDEKVGHCGIAYEGIVIDEYDGEPYFLEDVKIVGEFEWIPLVNKYNDDDEIF